MQFVVFKFDDGDAIGSGVEILYDVGLTKWIHFCDKNMNAVITWPPKSVDAGLLARKEKDSGDNWTYFPINIKGYYGEFHFYSNQVENRTKSASNRYCFDIGLRIISVRANYGSEKKNYENIRSLV